MSTVTDTKIPAAVAGNITYFKANVISAGEYAPLDMQLPGRTISASSYRYGFNGKENDNDVKGNGNQQDYDMRIYDPRIGKFLSVDPLQKQYPDLSTYQFAENDVIRATDLDGLEKNITITGQAVYGPVDMNRINESILSNYSKPQQQAMKKSAAVKQLVITNSKPKAPISPKRTGTSDHPEDFTSRKAAEQKMAFNTVQEQSINLLNLKSSTTIGAPSPFAGYSDFERGMITNPLIQGVAGGMLVGPAISQLPGAFTFSTDLAITKGVLSATYQGVVNGPSNIDVIDVGADMFLAPGGSAIVGGASDWRPFAQGNQFSLTGYNKPLQQSIIDGGIGYIGNKLGDAANNATIPFAQSALEKNTLLIGTQSPFVFGTQAAGKVVNDKGTPNTQNNEQQNK